MLPVARLTDKHDCPLHGINAIVTGGTATADGLPIARVGDSTACGATIIVGSSMANDNGRPIAYLGSATSHGGVITTGSSNHKTLP